MKINMNKELVFVKDFDMGKTQNIAVKIGRKTYMMDVDKNSHSTNISIYDKTSESRTGYTKYNNSLNSVYVKNDALLTKEFFEKFEEIAKAQAIVRRNKDVLSF